MGSTHQLTLVSCHQIFCNLFVSVTYSVLDVTEIWSENVFCEKIYRFVCMFMIDTRCPLVQCFISWPLIGYFFLISLDWVMWHWTHVLISCSPQKCYHENYLNSFFWVKNFQNSSVCESSTKRELKGAATNLYTFSLLHRMKKYCLWRQPLVFHNDPEWLLKDLSILNKNWSYIESLVTIRMNLLQH